MSEIHWRIIAELGCAWLAGGLIGVERSYNGRAAGFRTHALVAIASATAIMVCLTPILSPVAFPSGPLSLDPTRVAQGVMTGVGFLGAGVIFKEGVNVQGLTTAASIWATAALGMLFGLGAFFPATLATVAVLITLVILRWVEQRLPTQSYAWSVFRFEAAAAPQEEAFRDLLRSKGISLDELSYARSHGGSIIEFSGNLQTRTDRGFQKLAAEMRDLPGLTEFELSLISK